MKTINIMVFLLMGFLVACGGSGGSSPTSITGATSSQTASSKPTSSATLFSSSSSVAFKIVGYVPSWFPEGKTIQYDKLTHINYAFVLPNPDGSLQDLPKPQLLQRIVADAHANQVKVLVSVGGWNDGNDSGFTALAKTAEGRTRFTQAVVALVNQYQLDGIDIDWEYPREEDEPENFRLLMQELAQAMHSDNKLLTAAVIALGTTGDGVKTEVFEYVDFLNLMSYDKNNGNHSPYSFAVESIAYWSARGLPKHKLVVGVPYYARPSWNGYIDKVTQNPINNCRDTDGTDYWNGIPTIRQKAQLARNYGGLMTWELSHDTPGADSLLTAMWESLLGMPTSFVCP